MIFNFKKSKITVDCFTSDISIYKFYKVRKAVSFYPDDIRKLPLDLTTVDQRSNIEYQIPTLKRCSGIIEHYKHGAIIPLWMDFICSPQTYAAGKSAIGAADPAYAEGFSQHPPEQWTGMFKDFHQVKFLNPWRFRDKSGIKYAWGPAFYNLHEHIDNFVVPPGMMWWDFQDQANINVFVRKKAEKFSIVAGTPMIHFIPLTEREVEYKCHFVDPMEMEKLAIIPRSFPTMSAGSRNNKFFKARAEAERMDALEKKGKCPFGFGK